MTGAAILRRDLDVTLLEAAVSAGVDFTPSVRVDGLVVDAASRVSGVVASGRRMAAKVVIAADGRGSRLAFGRGLARFAHAARRWAFGAYFTGVQGVTTRGEMHVRPDGYLGVVDVGAGLTNVCVVRAVNRIRQERTAAENVIVRALNADPRLRERFRHARQVSRVTTLGPLAVEASAAGCPGLLLAGDAAGFVDPMTGDGLRFAFRGGELAAEAALTELKTGSAAYGILHDARRREFAAKWRLNRALRGLVDSSAGIKIAATVSAAWSWPVECLIGLAGDVSLARP
jgi:flavin-dependent dehydrogenase